MHQFNTDPIHIALATDDNYARHAGVVIASVLANANVGERHHFHIFTLGLSDLSIRNLSAVASHSDSELSFYVCDRSELAGFPEGRHTLNANLRLKIPDLLPDLKKILYLDSDLIVLDTLRDLWELDLGDHAVGAALDSIFFFKGGAPYYWEHLGLPHEARYFNSGVLLMNLEAWRRENLFVSIREWVNKNGHLLQFPDQNALNVVLAGRVKYLHLRWNVQVPLIRPVIYGWGCSEEQAEAASNPAIVHFVTGRKPWVFDYKLPFKKEYYLYLNQTPWANEIRPKPELKQFIRRIEEEIQHWHYKLRYFVRKLLGRVPEPSKQL